MRTRRGAAAAAAAAALRSWQRVAGPIIWRTSCSNTWARVLVEESTKTTACWAPCNHLGFSFARPLHPPKSSVFCHFRAKRVVDYLVTLPLQRSGRKFRMDLARTDLNYTYANVSQEAAFATQPRARPRTNLHVRYLHPLPVFVLLLLRSSRW